MGHQMPRNLPIKRTRAPNLDEAGIERIVLLLDSWSEPKLTWDLLIAHIQEKYQISYTRQALDRHARISDAYQFRKRQLSGQVRQATPDDLRINALQEEVARLKRENHHLLEQFVRWLNNVNLIERRTWEQDLREHREEIRKILDKQLPPADRGGSLNRKSQRNP